MEEINKTTKTFWKLLQGECIEIPIIQRDYAQGREGKEYLRKSFLTSLKQALDGKPLKLDFVYGSRENGKLQPLDGQQRLTTLWLLHWYIALFAKKQKEAFDILSRFSYETRISSREFIHGLCKPENFELFDSSKDRDVVKFIENSTWFYSEWKQDPSISSMLRMIKGTTQVNKSGEDILDGLEELFAHTEENQFEEYWKQLTETDTIVFYLQPLEDFGLSDDLYIKMNARGKQLTPFENFKADLIGYLREQELNTESNENQKWKELLDPQRGIPIKLDTEWTQIFWKKRSDDHTIDEIFFAFINRFFWNELFTGKDSEGNYILKLSSESKNASYEYFNADAFDKYVGFEPYKFYQDSIPASFFEKLKTILDNYYAFPGIIPEAKWMKGFNFIPTYKNDNKGNEEKIEISGINQQQRILFFAVCKYFNEGVADQQSLNRWMRVVYNLISGIDRTGNPEIREVDSLRKAISYLDTLESHNVISSLASKKLEGETDGNSVLAQRWKEEIAKAIQIEKNPDWETRIIEAEEYSFFHGAIRFLFQDENGNTDWTMFDTKRNIVQRFFVKDENQNSVMNDGYHNAELLKILFSRFTTDNFWGKLWWNYRTFNNKANTWMYYLLSPDLCNPIHYLLLGYSHSTKWENRSEKFAENSLYLLSHTGLLDYIRNKMSNSWIRRYNNHHIAIYPSSTGIFLDAYLRDDFLLGTDSIIINEDAKIPNTHLLYGWDINFRYKEHNFQWYRTDYVYLMEQENKNEYLINNPDGQSEEDKYFCFNTNGLSAHDIISNLDKLIFQKRLTVHKE